MSALSALLSFPLASPRQRLGDVLNHLLAGEDWARARLQAHRGKTVSISFGKRSLRLSVTDEGLFEAVDDVTRADDVTLQLPDSAWSSLLGKIGQERLDDALLKQVRLSGDADFAQALSAVLKHLRWDVEEDLSHWVGDAAAHFLCQRARQTAAGAQHAVHRAVSQLAEGLVHEKPTLVHRAALADWTEDIRTLREQLDRLDKRTQRLVAKGAHPGVAGL